MKKELSLLVTLLCTVFCFAQSGKASKNNSDDDKQDVVMTWNKNTPEQEMKDDIKSLSEYGVTIKYSNVKRNSEKEITGIDVSFEDKDGNKGALSYNNSKPIPTIKFYKHDDEVGFGEAGNSFGDNPFTTVFSGDGDFMKGYNFNFDNIGKHGQSFNFNMPETGIDYAQSKIIIKKDGKKPLIIQDGEVIEGGDDYTAEEIEDIKENNKIENLDYGKIYNFNNSSNGNLAEQMKKMQQQMDELMKNQGLNKSPENKELEDSKKELEKAKEELENAKKELKKTKSTIKTQKA